MKPMEFRGDSLDRLLEFPKPARREAGFQLDRVQRGLQPFDWKPLPIAGSGVQEIRIRDESGAYRVLYIAKLEQAVYVLHCFQKRTQETAKRDIELAEKRYRELLKGVEMSKKRFASVWDAIEDSATEAASMKLRAQLANEIIERMHDRKLTQSKAAELIGVTQPRISDLMRGRLHLFSLDALVDMADRLGLRTRIVTTPKRAA